MTGADDLMDCRQIAVLLGVEYETVRSWAFRRRIFPPAHGRHRGSGAALWPRSAVVAWAKETGRWTE